MDGSNFIKDSETKALILGELYPNQRFVVNLDYYEIVNISIKDNEFIVELKEINNGGK
jgi:hypothetical protein